MPGRDKEVEADLIAFIGERYGMIPSEKLMRTAIKPRKTEGFSLDDLEKSITELEIEFGAFSKEGQPERCLFYYRSPLPREVMGEKDREAYLPESFVNHIGDDAFSFCNRLSEILIPESVETIGNGAFNFCTEIKEVLIPSNVSSIGDGAFAACIGLTNMSIPKSVTSIGNNAFIGCIGITEVSIPDSVIKIGENAFVGCIGLRIRASVGSYAEEYALMHGISTNRRSTYKPIS